MSTIHDPALARAMNSTTVRSSNTPTAAAATMRLVRGAVRALGAASPDAAAAVAARAFGTPRPHARPAWEHEILERARRGFAVPLEDRSIAAWEWGEAGPRVVLMHGWEGRATQLGEMIEPLTELGFRVVGFDAPAHGDSTGSTTHFVDFGRALEAVNDAIGPVHAIVGHSMGAAVTSWIARERPLAKRYVAIAPPRAVADFVRSFEDLVAMEPDVRVAFEHRLERTLGVPLHTIRSDVGGYPTAPLLVVHDEHDREVPFACGETLAQHWPGAHLHRTSGLGHTRVLRDPSVVELVRRFVAWGSLPR